MVSSDLSLPEIPPPRLGALENLTDLAIFQCYKMAPGRRYHDVVVLKGAFELTSGALRPRGAGPIVIADEWWDSRNAERSSVKRAGDAILGKPATDVLVTGTARTHRARAAWDVAVSVRNERETLLAHQLRVTGPRNWIHRGKRWTIEDPAPVTEVPIRYELAFGGAYLEADGKSWNTHEPNPSGTGWFAPLDTTRAYPAPQWQLPSDPLSAPNQPAAVAGLGPIARPWSSRARLAGTYDEAWEQRVREDWARGIPPDYAPDFDARFFLCASPGLSTQSYLRGGEQLTLQGLLASKSELVTRLPDWKVYARLAKEAGQWSEHELPLDTVHVDLDAERVYLVWRLSLDRSLGYRAAILNVRERSNDG